ncbi:hypothetical protein IW140_003839 [Coemansia sp. RSA 1813]|nr:hypothetical protein EV178_005802 [Coemansia sp. RSA 1646]KAJ1765372.1 hypothetical protein LPJ74_006376 [Coemansia sp. RSA 1843]KAJ2086400.1 hypothetical protein IW138_005728 [Coemansia sp. RSA 986]KAJ2215667.1 hypothetical protein EV179_001891 [Coemansia sp. RSA 487]KAJ2568411.1 hypothetical protein IW140_003839 [Coemansia sp. RSA 1813]
MSPDYNNAQIAVITGANSGVGFAIARSLLVEHPSRFVIILACRNLKRAEAARNLLLAQVPPGGSTTAVVHLVELDTSSMASVVQAADTLSRLVPRIDLLFCNAGAMAIESLDVFGIVRGLLTHPIAFFESSEALRQRHGALSGDGLGLTFQTNVFGHYMLIHKLVPLMENHKARIIWTGSSASQLDFSRSDYQHIHGRKSYESSKFIVDQIAVPLDDRLQRSHGIRCYVAEPGNVCSSFLAGLESTLFLAIVVVAFYIIRTVIGLGRFTITSENACAACCFIALASEKELDPRVKYHSQVTRLGKPYVRCYPLSCCESTGAFLINRLDRLVDRFEKHQHN